MRVEHRILNITTLQNFGQSVANEFGHALLALRGAGGSLFLGHRLIDVAEPSGGCLETKGAAAFAAAP